ncbi:hypothetical protein [Pseudomonas fluorescens]|uniref:hypothetical protein n=1 Tax=Pseudomonas fluorescens TaxID=294 RepID=UPI0038274973
MRYISTRGQAPALNFEDVLLAGLATDGGLYVPENLPRFTQEEIASWAGLPYHELAFRVMRPFVTGSIPDADFKKILEETYGVFSHSAVAPLRQLNGNEWVLELFHGPTLAFKDFALQLLGRLLDYVLEKRGERVVIVATNRNDILHRFMSGNQYVKETLHATLSPSMDIMVSSNFERLLFDLHGRNGAAIAGLMDSFKQGGGFSVEQERWTEARKLFDSLAVDDAQTCETIAEVYAQCGEVLDPHTAIGVKAARECRRSLDIPMVILGTAHPVKFPDAVEKAGVGKALELPAHLSDLFERNERCTVLPNELKAVQAFVSQHGNRGKPL